MSAVSSYDVALQIHGVMTQVQSELKCSICRSTFSDPVSATCGHSFCKVCLDVAFQHERVVECPLCRQKIKKRSCTSSEQHDAAVKAYLQLARVFLKDQENDFSIPKDFAYVESQVSATTSSSDTPLHDFQPMPNFALPKARVRRRRRLIIKPDPKIANIEEVVEEVECKENTPAQQMVSSAHKFKVHVKSSILSAERHVQSKSVEVQCNIPDPACVCRNLENSLTSFRARNINDDSSQNPSHLHSLLLMLPELKEILLKDISSLCEMFELQPNKKSIKMELPNIEHLKDDALNDFSSDDDACIETQPPVFLKIEAMSHNLQLSEPGTEPPVSPSKTSGEVIPQSTASGDACVKEDDMDITIQVPFESFPESCGTHPTAEVDEILYSTSSMFITVSRMRCVEDEKMIEEFLKMFPNVHYEKDVTSQTTHLVMMNSRARVCPRRSLRYVSAIARKCEILDRSWFEDCLKMQKLIPTDQYQLTEMSEKAGWIRAREAKEPLFKHLKFFLPPAFSDSRLLPLKKLEELILLCGGQCYKKPWELGSSQNAYTIFMPLSTESDVARRYEASMVNVPVLNADWVLDSISEYRLMPLDTYRVAQKQ